MKRATACVLAALFGSWADLFSLVLFLSLDCLNAFNDFIIIKPL